MKAGERNNRLVSISMIDGRRWLFRCDCGSEVIAHVSNVRSGHTRSCGCLKREESIARNKTLLRTQGGLSTTAEYRAWYNMLLRCNEPSNHTYKYYGGRGIRVCERWHKFENFYADMGPRPTPMHSIERLNNDLNYEPKNCKWILRKLQQRNTRRSVSLIVHGQKMSLTEAAMVTGIKAATLAARIRRGTTPII